jgi:hypothetical protein
MYHLTRNNKLISYNAELFMLAKIDQQSKQIFSTTYTKFHCHNQTKIPDSNKPKGIAYEHFNYVLPKVKLQCSNFHDKVIGVVELAYIIINKKLKSMIIQNTLWLSYK